MTEENKTEEVLPDDIAAVLENYKQRHANGESYADMARQVENVDDKRLAAVLRKLDAGEDPAKKKAPVDRKPAGNKAVTAADDGKGK